MRLCQNKGLPEVHCLGKGVGPACQAVSRMRVACHPHRGTPASAQTDLPLDSWSGLISASASNSQALDQKRSTRLCKIHKLLLQSKTGCLLRVLHDFTMMLLIGHTCQEKCVGPHFEIHIHGLSRGVGKLPSHLWHRDFMIS